MSLWTPASCNTAAIKLKQRPLTLQSDALMWAAVSMAVLRSAVSQHTLSGPPL